jgi:hypothetical protein
MVWLLLNGPRRAFYSCVAACVVLWIVLPVLFFGIDGAVRIYWGWYEQIRIVGAPWVYLQYPLGGEGPPLVTLRKAVMFLTGAAADATRTQSYVLMLLSVWGAALTWYAWRAARAGRVGIPSRAALADWTVLLLAPLPFSPWLEPYHAIPLFPGAMLCVILVLDERLAAKQRIIAVAALVALAIAPLLIAPFPVRGLRLLVQFLALVIALGLLRPTLHNGTSNVPKLRDA